jgi:NADPH:quinone reductase-like Zn-dependent oxidoreductase
MRAVLFHEYGGVDKLRYEEVGEPTLNEEDVLVRVKACSLNHIDIWNREGVYKVDLPHIPGSDVSGVVEKVGKKVREFRIGDKVIISPAISCFKCDNCLSGNDNLCDSFKIFGSHTNGGYAEFAKAHKKDIIPIPMGVSFEQAAAFPLVFLTAWHMLIHRAQVKRKQSVLILAAGGGLGTAAIQIAKYAGATVIAAAGSEEKLKKAKELGADDTINYKEVEFDKEARRLTNGKGVDVVFESIGKETWQKSINALAKNGKIVIAGASGGDTAELNIRHLYGNQFSILGSIMGTRKELLEISKLIAIGKLKPVIDSVYPLKEAGKAQEMMLGRKNFGKLVLVP